MHCILSMVVNFILLAFIKLYRWCAYHPVIHYSMPLAPVDNNRAVGGLTEQGRHCPIHVQWKIRLAFVSSRVVVGHLVRHAEQHSHRVGGTLYCRNITLPSCHRLVTEGVKQCSGWDWHYLTPPSKNKTKASKFVNLWYSTQRCWGLDV